MANQQAANPNQKVHAMLERFSKAFTSANGKEATKYWEVPALIVADMGTRAVSTLKEVENFYDASAKQYTDMGITGTRPEVRDIRWPTDRIAIADVDWPYTDAKGHDTGKSESTTYVLHVGDDGEPRITVAVMRGMKGG